MSQQTFRHLHHTLLHYEGKSPYADVLLPWLAESQEEQAWLKAFAQQEGSPIPPATDEDLWSLYALSRICDVLITRFQDEGPDLRDQCSHSDRSGLNISLEEFSTFLEALGLSMVMPESYSPFFHEVVKVDQAISPGAQIIAYRWPSVMLGNLLVLRGGVEVSADEGTLKKGIADSTTLYWTYMRKWRPHEDLSHGWGSNSQWRTALRRDYLIDGIQYFNVDGATELALPGQEPTAEFDPDDDLTAEERIELLTNRCFVTSTRPHADLFPYDYKFKMTTSGNKGNAPCG